MMLLIVEPVVVKALDVLLVPFSGLGAGESDVLFDNVLVLPTSYFAIATYNAASSVLHEY